MTNLIDDTVGIAVLSPCFYDNLDGVNNDGLCNLSSGLVEDKTEVILGQETVRRIRSVGIIEDFILVICIDDSLASLPNYGGSLREDRLETNCMSEV